MRKIDRVVNQMSSGKWILTILAGVAFFLFSWALTRLMLRVTWNPETLVALFASLLLIVQGVYKDYFNREDDEAADTTPDPPETPPAPPVDPSKP